MGYLIKCRTVGVREHQQKAFVTLSGFWVIKKGPLKIENS